MPAAYIGCEWSLHLVLFYYIWDDATLVITYMKGTKVSQCSREPSFSVAVLLNPACYSA